ncbi:MAG: accessory gene regulator B family protein [Bacilli bacterium]|nr:accessory gene regulator B family protein [Bacilli bacterium]
MIKNYLINSSMNLINELGQYNEEKQAEIKYGLEGIYIAVSKVVVILFTSAILGLFKEAIMFLLLFNALRIVAFGLHASKSIYCWISSSISFLLIPYLSKTFEFPNIFYIVVSTISIISFILYAPADTIKRPLINTKKRHIYKLLSILLASIFIILIFIINNLLIKNLLTFALILETILILPITYKIFKLPYNNYKNYKG